MGDAFKRIAHQRKEAPESGEALNKNKETSPLVGHGGDDADMDKLRALVKDKEKNKEDTKGKQMMMDKDKEKEREKLGRLEKEELKEILKQEKEIAELAQKKDQLEKENEKLHQSSTKVKHKNKGFFVC